MHVPAAEVHDYAIELPQLDSHFAANLTGLNFCNVSITYTHPGQNDTIHTQTWLPLGTWNGRFLGTGGGGWITGYFELALARGVSEGYACVSTDGGHAANHQAQYSEPQYWALASPGNINWYLLENFASKALNDMTILGKAITKSYYGKAAKYSYWSGCSTGGRQGMLQAQRYPESYDGILAAAPAINWQKCLVAEYWGQQVANRLNYHPSICELDAITAAATEACDTLDGLKDGIIAHPNQCFYNAMSAVGTPYSCPGNTGRVSEGAATIANAVWAGPHTVTGTKLWYGLNRDAAFERLVNCTCTSATNCTGNPFTISSDWIRYFVEKKPDFDYTTMSYPAYDAIFHKSVDQFTSVIGTDDPDLSAFQASGGKLISWHGLVDQVVFPNGTADYYNRVKADNADVESFYRFFEAPGVAHCGGGVGAFPSRSLETLVKWVEQGKAPQTLPATTLPVNGTVRHADLCMYPLIWEYQRGDIAAASSYECVAKVNGSRIGY